MLELIACGAAERTSKDHIALCRFVEFPICGDHVAATGADIVEKDDRPLDFVSDMIDALEMARVSRAAFVRFYLRLGEDKRSAMAGVAFGCIHAGIPQAGLRLTS